MKEHDERLRGNREHGGQGNGNGGRAKANVSVSMFDLSDWDSGRLRADRWWQYEGPQAGTACRSEGPRTGAAG